MPVSMLMSGRVFSPAELLTRLRQILAIVDPTLLALDAISAGWRAMR
jgi:hypothetical protein